MRILKNPLDSKCLKIFFPAFILAMFLSLPCLAEPAGETDAVVAIGSALIVKDVPTARDAAVAQSLRMAVEKTALQILPVERATEKFDALGTLLAGNPDAFVQDYKVLKESTDGKTYRVLVQATVFSGKLKQNLGADGKPATGENLPTVLFMMTEQQADTPSTHYWWQGGKSVFQPDMATVAMKRVFADSGFAVVDEKTIPFTLIEDLQLTTELTDAQIIETGKRAKAEVVVAGAAVALEAPNRIGETTLTFKGNVTARPIFVETGETLPAAINSQTALHQDKTTGSRKALSEAGKQAGLNLAPQILTKWKAQSETGGDIFISLTGPDILTQMVEFRAALKRIEGVASLQTLEMGPDKAMLKVTFEGTPQALADAVVLESFDTFSVNVSEISGNQLQIQLTAQ